MLPCETTHLATDSNMVVSDILLTSSHSHYAQIHGGIPGDQTYSSGDILCAGCGIRGMDILLTCIHSNYAQVPLRVYDLLLVHILTMFNQV